MKPPSFKLAEALYELGLTHHMLRFWVEKSWFETEGYPCSNAWENFKRLITAIDQVSSHSALHTTARRCLSQMRDAAYAAWQELWENWSLPQAVRVGMRVVRRPFAITFCWTTGG
jgi:hypothetical protein